MAEEKFSAELALSGLKDFQRRTVDYVFERFYGEENTTRFLVADEVGLGKTMVARGVIARALEHLHDCEPDRQVDILYVCSNAAIAQQNVARLNVTGKKDFVFPSRLTLLPTQVHQLSKNRVNFISFTPGTALDLKGRCGAASERAVIYRMLKCADWVVNLGLLNMLQAYVRRRDRWEWLAEEQPLTLDDELGERFRDAVCADAEMKERLRDCCERFQAFRPDVPGEDARIRNDLIGDLRRLLARICVDALQPDLIILDEFQRFKDLLHGKHEAGDLARTLFGFEGARTLLLSATPYRMLSLDHEKEDDHYPDFLRTLAFLLGEDADDALENLRREIQAYRTELLGATRGAGEDIASVRDRLQGSLLQVMCRTERVGMTASLDAMLSEPEVPARLRVEDLVHADMVSRIARAVGVREPIEYWKSSPYLLSFLKDYEFRRAIDEVAKEPPEELLEALRGGSDHLLTGQKIEDYEEVDAANARMRTLFSETLDQGLWRLLWMPPSLPYSEPSGAYADVGSVTKRLVFSSWNAVPNAIAALCSYEAERRMLDGQARSLKHSALYQRLAPLIRFNKGQDGRLAGMPALAWLFPSVRLSTVIDPLEIALEQGGGKGPISLEELLKETEARCEELLSALPPGGDGNRVDERWYWAALGMLEPSLVDWCSSDSGWNAADADHPAEATFREHIAHFVEAMLGELELGPRPGDLARVLAEFALAGPGVCAHRALRRIAPSLDPEDPQLLSGAARVAGGFRKLFNVPETIGLLRERGDEPYWRRSLEYALEGNIQSLLDEQAHVLVEQLGLAAHDDGDKVEGVSTGLSEGLSIRTAQIRVDELSPNGKSVQRTDFNTRCRFALRFGDLRDDSDSTLARADTVRTAFNSPFRPFVLASTSIGQEGLDFHTWCHAVVHWNLPSNPVDLEQREGRVHRYKGHAVRKNIAEHYGLAGLEGWDGEGDPWSVLFERAKAERPADSSDLVPFWIFEGKGSARIERRVPLIPFSKEEGQLDRLRRDLALYRVVFGQPRQQDLLAHLSNRIDADEVQKKVGEWRISLEPPEAKLVKLVAVSDKSCGT